HNIYQEMDLKAINSILKVGRIFALTPSSTENRKPSIFQKCYVILVFLTLTVGASLVMRIVMDIDLFLHDCYSLFILMIFKRERWFKLIKNLRARYKHQTFLLREKVCTKRQLKYLEKIKRNIFFLKDCVDVFNDIFGWIFLFNIIFGVARSLIYLDMIVISLNGFRIDNYFKNALRLLSHINVVSIFWVEFLSIALICDEILKEFGEILTIANNLGMISVESEEVRRFFNSVNDNRPEFTAARFFSIDRSAIFTVLNAMTTFLIVM
ncbi:uncharacterized protein BDFB_011115, partial [Asbolus verrucosus]